MPSYSSEIRPKMKEQTIHPDKIHDTTTTNNGYVVGVDIGGTNLRLALADMAGTIVARQSSSTASIRDAAVVIELVHRGVDALLKEVSASRSSLRAIAAGAPGVTDVDEGIVIATSYLMGWRDVPLRSLLERSLGVPATVDNDVNMAAIGESWAGSAKGARDFVFIAIGTGIGAGIILNGQPFRGLGWAAGEIGYMLVPGVSDKPTERGDPGALESLVGGEGIKAEWQRQWREDKTSLPRELTATAIFDGASTGDPLAKTILQQSAHMLSYAIYNMSLVLNCPLFVMGGGVGRHPVLCDATQKALEQWSSRSHLQLTRSTLDAEAQLMGAIRLALDAAKSRSTLLVGAE